MVIALLAEPGGSIGFKSMRFGRGFANSTSKVEFGMGLSKLIERVGWVTILQRGGPSRYAAVGGAHLSGRHVAGRWSNVEGDFLGCVVEGRKEGEESEGEGKNIYPKDRAFLGPEGSGSGLVKTGFFSGVSLLVEFDVKNE
jgi:hypothetical protein